MENIVNESGNFVLSEPLDEEQFKGILDTYLFKKEFNFVCVEARHNYVHDLRQLWLWSRDLKCEIYIKDNHSLIVCKAGVKPPKKSDAVMRI